jgi:hypothetical protein
LEVSGTVIALGTHQSQGMYVYIYIYIYIVRTAKGKRPAGRPKHRRDVNISPKQACINMA